MTKYYEWQRPPEDPDAQAATPLAETAKKRKLANVVSKIVDYFNPKPPEVDAKYKHGRHSVKDNTPIVTERDDKGTLKQKRTGEEDLRLPEYGRVFPAAVDWWFNHATDLMNFWPDGPGEDHRFYDQWQMARTFVHKGRVNKALIMKAFEEDHDFYEKTMFFKRYNALMLKNGLGMSKVIRQRYGLVKEAQKPLGDEILVHEAARGGGNDWKEIIPSVLEAEAAAVMALGTISLALTVAGGTLALPPALLATVSLYAASAGIAVIGGTGSILIGQDAILRIVRAAKKMNELDNLVSVCGQALAVIKDRGGDCEFMRMKFGIDPSEVEVGTDGKLHFTQGSTSMGWTDAEETLIQEDKFREWFLKDLVLLDHKGWNPFHNRFRKVHINEDQFLTESNGRLIINQTGAAYEREWANRFEAMRRERNVGGNLDLVRGNKQALQDLYMEAGKSLCIEVANARFAAKVQPELLKRDADPIMHSADSEVKKRIKALSKGATTDGVVSKDGEERQALKKEAQAVHDRAVDLKDGMKEKEGNPAKAGLAQAIEKIRGTEASSGLINRQKTIDALYTECTNAFAQSNILYKMGVEIRELKNIRSIEEAIIKVRQAIEKIGEEGAGKKDEIIFDLEERLKQELDLHKTTRDKIDSDTTSYIGTQGQTRRVEALSKEDERFGRAETTLTGAISRAKAERQKLDTILVTLQEKKETLEREYARLAYSTLERENVAGLAEEMKQSYTRLKAAIPPSRLILYGTPGNLMGDFMTSIIAVGGIWTPPQDRLYENQLTVLYAVAEARAKNEHKKLHTKPSGLHADILDKTKANISPEQLITMSPYEVYDRITKLQKWNPPPPYGKLNIELISRAIAEETARYEAREKALQSVMDTQSLVVARHKKEIDLVDDACEARIDQLTLLKSVIEDRAAIYHLAPEMVRTGSLAAYADGTHIPPGDITHSTSEMNHPVGFVKFMQDIFAYHTFDTTNLRPTLTTEPNTMTRHDKDIARLKDHNRDKLLDSLFSSLGAPPERQLAQLIIDGYGKDRFTTLLEGGIDPATLSFDNVMAVIAYRHDHTFPRPNLAGAPIAVLRTADSPVKTFEMKGMLETVVVTLTKKAMAGHI